MALITMPSKVLFKDVGKFQLLRSGTSMRSRYTGKRQAVSFPFALWVFEGQLIPMDGLDAGEWRAFLVALEGEQNTFQLPVPGVAAPLSGYTGTVTAGDTAAAARVKTMGFKGLPSALTTILKKGDYFTINGELKVATADCISPAASTLATVQFEPGLRVPIGATSNLPVTILNPFCTMSAMDNEVASWKLTRPINHSIVLKAIEAF